MKACAENQTDSCLLLPCEIASVFLHFFCDDLPEGLLASLQGNVGFRAAAFLGWCKCSRAQRRCSCAAATLVDTVTSAALVTVSKKSGMSLSIGVDYLSPGAGGEDVEIDARVRGDSPWCSSTMASALLRRSSAPVLAADERRRPWYVWGTAVCQKEGPPRLT